MSSETTVEELRSELARREIDLEMDGEKLVAVDSYHRLSPALAAAIQAHRAGLVAELNPVSAALKAFREAIDNVVIVTELKPILNDIDDAERRGDLTPEETEELVQQARSRQIPFTFEEMDLAEFGSSGRMTEVASKVLGERVLWAADNAELQTGNDLVVYRAAELRELKNKSPEQLRRIHLTKKIMDGEVTSNPGNGREIATQRS